MKSLLLTTSFLPTYGGIETYVHELAKALDDHDLTVAAPSVRGDCTFDESSAFKIVRYNRDAETLGYRDALRLIGKNLFSTRWPSPRRRWPLSAPSLPALAGLLTRRSLLKSLALQTQLFAVDAGLLPTDLIQAGTALPSGIIAWVIQQRFGTPYVIYTHGMELLLWGSCLRTRWLLTKVLSEATWVGAVSRFTASLLKELGVPQEAIRLVPPGIETASFCQPQDVQQVRQLYGLSNKQVILTHGRLDPRKGHDMVIRALPKVIAACPNTIYLITGTGPNEGMLRDLAGELNLKNHVIFGGRIPDEFIPNIYQACDVFVMASRQINQNVEGFGIVCLEAAAAGRPVVAGHSGGIVDAIKDGVTGYLVNPEDPNDIANRLIELLRDSPLRERLGTAGRQRVQRDFTAAAFAARLRGYLEEAIQIHSIQNRCVT